MASILWFDETESIFDNIKVDLSKALIRSNRLFSRYLIGKGNSLEGREGK
jgi:hypothetical protein